MIAPTPLLVGEFLDFPGFCSRRELIEYMDSRRPLSSNEGKKQETFTTSPVDSRDHVMNAAGTQRLPARFLKGISRTWEIMMTRCWPLTYIFVNQYF